MRKYMEDARPKLLNFQDFKSDNFSAKTTDLGAYVVYSYTTPIAVLIRGHWFIVRKRYSTTTAMQMSALSQILSDADIVFRYSNPEQFKDLLTAAGL